MPDEFTHAVFLSHSSRDKALVRPLAERLRADGVKVSSDEWGFPSPAGAGEGARRAGEGRGAALNNERRFIPLRLDDAHITGSLVPCPL